MYAAPLLEERKGAPARTSEYVSPFSRPTATARPNCDPAVVCMIVLSGVFVPDPVREEPLNKLILPNVFIPAVTVVSPTMRSSFVSLSICPLAMDIPKCPFVLLKGANVRSGVGSYELKGEKYTYEPTPDLTLAPFNNTKG